VDDSDHALPLGHLIRAGGGRSRLSPPQWIGRPRLTARRLCRTRAAGSMRSRGVRCRQVSIRCLFATHRRGAVVGRLSVGIAIRESALRLAQRPQPIGGVARPPPMCKPTRSRWRLRRGRATDRRTARAGRLPPAARPSDALHMKLAEVRSGAPGRRSHAIALAPGRFDRPQGYGEFAGALAKTIRSGGRSWATRNHRSVANGALASVVWTWANYNPQASKIGWRQFPAATPGPFRRGLPRRNGRMGLLNRGTQRGIRTFWFRTDEGPSPHGVPPLTTFGKTGSRPLYSGVAHRATQWSILLIRTSSANKPPPEPPSPPPPPYASLLVFVVGLGRVRVVSADRRATFFRSERHGFVKRRKLVPEPGSATGRSFLGTGNVYGADECGGGEDRFSRVASASHLTGTPLSRGLAVLSRAPCTIDDYSAGTWCFFRPGALGRIRPTDGRAAARPYRDRSGKWVTWTAGAGRVGRYGMTIRPTEAALAEARPAPYATLAPAKNGPRPARELWPTAAPDQPTLLLARLPSPLRGEMCAT